MLIEPQAHRTMIETLRSAGARGPWLALLAELVRLSEGFGALVHHAERPWSAITFSGTRHTFRLAFEGAEAVAAGESLIAALPEHEFALPGRLVAEATVISAEHTLIPTQRLVLEAQLLVLDDA